MGDGCRFQPLIFQSVDPGTCVFYIFLFDELPEDEGTIYKNCIHVTEADLKRRDAWRTKVSVMEEKQQNTWNL